RLLEDERLPFFAERCGLTKQRKQTGLGRSRYCALSSCLFFSIGIKIIISRFSQLEMARTVRIMSPVTIYLTYMVVFVIFPVSDPQTKLIMINTILIDDDYPVLKSIEKRLQQIDGLNVLQAFTDIAAALAFLRSYGKIDLIFCDIEMPDLNGVEAAPLLRPYCQRFVFLTGHKEYALAAFGVHADGYLLKPVDKKEVLKEMAELERESNGVATDALMSHCLVVK